MRTAAAFLVGGMLACAASYASAVYAVVNGVAEVISNLPAF